MQVSAYILKLNDHASSSHLPHCRRKNDCKQGQEQETLWQVRYQGSQSFIYITNELCADTNLTFSVSVKLHTRKLPGGMFYICHTDAHWFHPAGKWLPKPAQRNLKHDLKKWWRARILLWKPVYHNQSLILVWVLEYCNHNWSLGWCTGHKLWMCK
jgi:hypothetical protein